MGAQAACKRLPNAIRISRGCGDNGQGCNRNLALAPTGLVQGPVLAVADLLLGGILETHCHLRLVLEG